MPLACGVNGVDGACGANGGDATGVNGGGANVDSARGMDMRGACQGMTCFPLQMHLGVFPTLTLDTFGILRTPTASEFQRHFRVFLVPSPFQQSPTLLCAPSPRLTLPLKVTPRPPPPLKVAQRPLQTPYPPIQTPL